jgi:hypothetical protein
MSTQRPTKTEQELRGILSGIQQVLTAGKTFPLMGANLDQATLLTTVNGLLAPYSNVHQQRTLLEKGLGDRNTGEPNAKGFVQSFKSAAAGTYGETSLEFSLFGFAPRKKPIELTPEQKQHKLAQLRATRAARKTLGSRQRAAIKGVVTGTNGSNAVKP